MESYLTYSHSDFDTHHRASQIILELASEAEHRRCALPESLDDRHRPGPSNFCSPSGYGRPNLGHILGPDRGLSQRYRCLPNSLSKPLCDQSRFRQQRGQNQ